MGSVAIAVSLLLALALPAHAQRADSTAAISTAEQFLLAWGHGRPDLWDHAARDTIVVHVGQAEQMLRRADEPLAVALVFPFKGLTTVRAGDEVKGIEIQSLCLRVQDERHCGQGTLTLARTSDGAYRVTAVSLAIDR